MGPYAGVYLTLCPRQSRLEHIYHGPKSTLNLCQSRLYPPARDFGFGLREGERNCRIPILSVQEYKLAASPEICLVGKPWTFFSMLLRLLTLGFLCVWGRCDWTQDYCNCSGYESHPHPTRSDNLKQSSDHGIGQTFCSFVRIGSPRPINRKRVLPAPLWFQEGTQSGGRGGGGSQFRRRDRHYGTVGLV